MLRNMVGYETLIRTNLIVIQSDQAGTSISHIRESWVFLERNIQINGLHCFITRHRHFTAEKFHNFFSNSIVLKSRISNCR